MKILSDSIFPYPGVAIGCWSPCLAASASPRPRPLTAHSLPQRRSSYRHLAGVSPATSALSDMAHITPPRLLPRPRRRRPANCVSAPPFSPFPSQQAPKWPYVGVFHSLFRVTEEFQGQAYLKRSCTPLVHIMLLIDPKMSYVCDLYIFYTVKEEFER